MDQKMKKRSIKMNDEDYQAICQRAEQGGENFSSYCRRVLMESVYHPFYTGKDVMGALYCISCEMASCDEENICEVKERINKRGVELCQMLSL